MTLQELWQVSPLRDDTLADVAGLGPPPRMLDSRMHAYLRRAVPSLAPLWLVLAIFCAAGDTLMVANGVRHLPVLTLLFAGLAIRGFVKRRAGRERVCEVLRTGELQRATVANMLAVEKRGRYGRIIYVDYTVVFTLANGQKVVLKTRDPGVSLLQIGVIEEVVWSQAHPDVIVPTTALM